MAKPATTPTWATNTNFATGGKVGFTAKVMPSYVADGFRPNTAFIGAHANWLLYWLCQWAAYLGNLHNEAAGFLDQAFTWTGAHTFDTAEATFTQEIQAEGGIDTVNTPIVTGSGNITTTSGAIATSGGGFSTTTGSFTSTSGGSFSTTSGNFASSSAGNHTTTGAGVFSVASPSTNQRFVFTGTLPTVTKTVNLFDGAGSSVWTKSGVGLVTSGAVAGQIYKIPLDSLPQGATIKGFTVGGTQGSDDSGSGALTVELEVWTISGGGISEHGSSPIAGDSFGGTFGVSELITNTSTTWTVDNGTERYFLAITASTSAGADSIAWARVHFQDPGPRNN